MTHNGLTNITGESSVIGERIVEWVIYDDDGMKHMVRTKAYYVSDAKVRFFSVQTYLGVNKGSFLVEGSSAILMFRNGK